MTFQELNLNSQILKAIEELGYKNPTPIQEQAIPHVLAGSDLMACAQTGTGKTAAFILPALNALANSQVSSWKGPRILVLTPTRELALQIANAASLYGKYVPRSRTVCILGGMPYHVQNRQLARPYEILVATPGRLIDHLERGTIDFSRIEMVVLDEADRMLDMGFIDEVERIIKMTPDTRQTLLFSATLKGPITRLARQMLKNPVEVTIVPAQTKNENIEQRLLYVDDFDHKNRLLSHILTDESINQTIVFTATKRNVDQLVDFLYQNGHRAAALHGDMSQNVRNRTIERLRKGAIRILVATDVAARGIDIAGITHVINFDLPQSSEDYVHRIGRTGRAGAQGIALSFASNKDMLALQRIQRYIGQTIKIHVIPGFEPKFKPSMRDGRDNGNNNGNNRSRGFRPRRSSGFGRRHGNSGYGYNSDRQNRSYYKN